MPLSHEPQIVPNKLGVAQFQKSVYDTLYTLACQGTNVYCWALGALVMLKFNGVYLLHSWHRKSSALENHA